MFKNIKNWFGRTETPSERYRQRYYEKKGSRIEKLDCQHEECSAPLCGCEAARKGYN